MSGNPNQRGARPSSTDTTTHSLEAGLSQAEAQEESPQDDSEIATPSGEGQAISTGLALPFLARVSKGRLNVSEASLPSPISSNVSASGEVFIPAHDHPNEWSGKGLQDRKGAEAENSDARPGASQPISASKSGHSIEGPTCPEGSAAEATREPSEKKTLEHSTNAFGEVSEAIPQIRIQRPSTPTMANSIGTMAINNPQNLGSTATEGASSVQAAGVSPLSGSLNRTLPVSELISTLPLPLPLPDLPLGGKKGKTKKLVRRVRKHVVRKRFLRLLLGPELASLVHPLLKSASNAAGAVPLPVDGGCDLVSSCAGYSQRNQITKTASPASGRTGAKRFVGWDETTRCPLCRGMPRLDELCRYHRSQLLQEKVPNLGINTFARASPRLSEAKRN